jgi:hypothetical protein
MDIPTFMMHFIETPVSGFEGIRTGIIRCQERVNGQWDDMAKKFSTMVENMDRLSVSIATQQHDQRSKLKSIVRGQHGTSAAAIPASSAAAAASGKLGQTGRDGIQSCPEL